MKLKERLFKCTLCDYQSWQPAIVKEMTHQCEKKGCRMVSLRPIDAMRAADGTD